MILRLHIGKKSNPVEILVDMTGMVIEASETPPYSVKFSEDELPDGVKRPRPDMEKYRTPGLPTRFDKVTYELDLLNFKHRLEQRKTHTGFAELHDDSHFRNALLY